MNKINSVKNILYLYSRQKYKESEKIIQDIIKTKPKTIIFRTIAAFKSNNINDWSNPELWDEMSAVFPFRRYHLELFYLCARARFEAGAQRVHTLNEAELALGRAVALRQNHPINSICKAEIYLARGDTEAQATELKYLLQNSFYRPYVTAMLVANSSHRSEDILESYNHNNTRAYIGLPREEAVYFYARLGLVSSLLAKADKDHDYGHIVEASYILESIKDQGGTSSIFYEYVGACLLDLGYFDLAEQSYNQSYRLENTPEALCGLAQVAIAKGRYDEATLNADQALSMRADYEPAIYVHALVHFERQEYEIAIHLLEGLVESRPNHINRIETLGKALIASGKDFQRGRELMSFANQLRSGVGSSEGTVHAALNVLSALVPQS